MEHRYARRIMENLDVLLRCRGDKVLQGTSRNISTNGIFVELFGNCLRQNDMVEVEYERNGFPRFKQRSLVVHVRQDGVGLIFGESDNSLNRRMDAAA